MSEIFSVEVEQVYGVDGYCQQKECYGGILMTVTDNVTDMIVAEVDDEEAFMYSGYHKKIWMSDLDEVVGDVMAQTKTDVVGYSETQLEALELEVRTVIKTAIMVEALGAWYSEPDYVSGWDEVSVAV
jgi:hypothetical protein